MNEAALKLTEPEPEPERFLSPEDLEAMEEEGDRQADLQADNPSRYFRNFGR